MNLRWDIKNVRNLKIEQKKKKKKIGCSFIVLGTYFYVIGISFDKTQFICIWVNLSRFKIIITSG